MAFGKLLDERDGVCHLHHHELIKNLSESAGDEPNFFFCRITLNSVTYGFVLRYFCGQFMADCI